MSLHLDLMVNDKKIGFMEIQRVNKLHGSKPDDNAQYTYNVLIDGTLLGQVDHRYGDGPWALLHKASMLATYHPSGTWAKSSGIKA